MKTFNSIFANGNVKSIIAIAAVAISSVFGFTSCDKNDDAFSNAPAAQNSNQQAQQTPTDEAQNPDTVTDAYLYTAATLSQQKYFDASYTLTVDGKTMVVKFSDMNEVKNPQRLSNAMGLLQVYDAAVGVKEEIKIYEFHIGNVKKARIESMKLTALSAKADHEIGIFTGAEILNNGNLLSYLQTGYVRNDDIAGIASIYNE